MYEATLYFNAHLDLSPSLLISNNPPLLLLLLSFILSHPPLFLTLTFATTLNRLLNLVSDSSDLVVFTLPVEERSLNGKI